MYRCNECGAEYDIKPDFCDCGNDSFTEVQGQAKPKEVYVQQTSSQPSGEKTTSKMTFEEQYPELERLKQVFDPISTAIFMICVITGLLIIFVVGNPEKSTETTKKNETSQATTEIPSIDSIWDNSTVGVINNEKVLSAQKAAQKNTVQTASEKVIPQTQTQTQQPQNPMLAKVQNDINTPTPVQLGQTVQKTNPQPAQATKTQPTQTKQPKPQPQAPKQTQTQKPAASTSTTPKNTNTQPVTQTTNPKPNIPKNTQAAANQPKVQSQPSTPQYTNTQQTQTQQTKPKSNNTTTTASNSSSKPTSSAQTQTSKPASTQQVPVQTTLRPKATIDTQAMQKELSNYKVGLRNTIGRKIDFANVIGDGDCVVSFTIASNGKLTNRKFTKQSSNITLNDAVYRAVMATPSYNPPPSGYKNETLNLKIRFYNGNFDVSLN